MRSLTGNRPASLPSLLPQTDASRSPTRRQNDRLLINWTARDQQTSQQLISLARRIAPNGMPPQSPNRLTRRYAALRGDRTAQYVRILAPRSCCIPGVQ